MDATSVPPSPVTRRDVARAAVLGALGLGAYLALLQTRLYGDGPGLVGFHALSSGRDYHHVLYLPFCALVRALLGTDDPLLAPRVASAIGGGLGCFGSFLLARLLGARPFGALVGTLLVGGSPLILFFATTVEVHALHFGGVALAAAATMVLPWRRVAIALPLAALIFPLTWATHATGALLGPGWVLLVALARRRSGAPPFSIPRLLFLVGPVLLAGLVIALGFSNLYRIGRFDPFELSREAEIVGVFVRPPSAHRLWVEGFLLPQLVLWPTVVVAFARRRFDALELAFMAAILIPSYAFFAWWGVIERGAYFAGTAPFLGWLAARAFDAPTADGMRARSRAFVVAVLVGVQVTAGVVALVRYDSGFDPRERADVVRTVVGEEGVLISCTERAPNIAIHLPNVLEISLIDVLSKDVQDGVPPEQAAPAVLALEPFFERGTVAFDMSWRTPEPRVAARLRLPYLRALEDALRERYDVEALDHEDWPMLRISPRP